MHTVAEQALAGRYSVFATVKTRDCARTGLFDPDTRRMFVPIPASGGNAAG